MAKAEFGLSIEKNPNAFSLQSKFVPASNMKQTTPVKKDDDDTVRNFHVFSYRNGTPMIARRVINETAAVVDYLDSKVLGAKN